MTTNESLCAKCAGIRHTCCQQRDIYVTLGDIRRIGRYTGKTDFYEFRLPPDLSYVIQEDDPLWAQHTFNPDGRHRVLKTDAKGDCLFLGDTGCILPLDTRPLICRMHPYEYNAQGIYPETAKECPKQLLTEGQTVIDAIGMDLNSALEWHKRLYMEITEREVL